MKSSMNSEVVYVIDHFTGVGLVPGPLSESDHSNESYEAFI